MKVGWSGRERSGMERSRSRSYRRGRKRSRRERRGRRGSGGVPEIKNYNLVWVLLLKVI